jgi:apolipoprotein N-acyltransferase
MGQAAAVVWKIRFDSGERGRYLLAIVAGLLLAISFPKISVSGLAWIAPGLMLLAAMGHKGWAAFRIGYVAGLTHHLASLYWLLEIPVKVAPVVGWLALAAFLALYPATWVWVGWKIYPAKPSLASPQFSSARVIDAGRTGGKAALRLLDEFLCTTWPQRLGWTLCCAALWVTWEMVQARLFSGFPWNLLGASQYRMVPLIQIASVTGVYGVSFVVAWFSVSLLCAGAALMRQSGLGRGWAAELMLPLFVAVGTASFGFRQSAHAPVPAAMLKIALIQPSIPQTVIWDPKEAAARFHQLIHLSEQALTNQPDLLVWPEAAVPSIFRWDTNRVYKGRTIYEATTDLARQHKVWLIMGADDVELHAENPERVNYFNSSFLINPAGEVLASYRKQRLVIFGEYVPLSRWLPFLKDFTQVYGEFTPGKKPVTFHLPALNANISVLICFEDVFPHLARKHAGDNIDFLLNLTNNGWFGESAAQWQHAANAVFRAVENGLPLVRAANNGLTCWVDAQGRLHDVFFQDSDNIYKAGFKIVQVPLRADQPPKMTVYRRYGDLFGWICVGLGTLVVGCSLAKQKRHSVQTKARDSQPAPTPGT